MLEEEKIISTRQKALRINLDAPLYGSFAEIGAGQEVAAIFFKAGAASGTIAKTMSAYDMTFSDAIYGKEESGRYVCEPRLMKMLEKEYNLLEVRLSEKRGATSHFFAFADTVTTINFAKTSQGHGWMGLRFQLSPQSPPNDAIIHVRMHDREAIDQQHALGILGVNLIYACFYLHHDAEKFVLSLFDNLSRERIEIDMIRLEGPNFQHIDNRLLSLKLVKFGLTDAAIFNPQGHMLQASEVLYKKNILVLRGRFRPTTLVNMDMLASGLEEFLETIPAEEQAQTLVLTELTLNDLRSDSEHIDFQDFLSRAEILCSLGLNVMVSNYHEYHRLVGYLSQQTRKKIGIVMGMGSLENICQEKHYTDLKGGVLEAFSRLFINDLHLYVYPYQKPDGNLQQVANFRLSPHLQDLLKFLVFNGKITDIQKYNPDILHIYSDKVLAKIQSGDPTWEAEVPPEVSEKIKSDRLFGYNG